MDINQRSMKVTKKIEQELQQIPEGRLFRYEDLPIEPSEYEAAAKAMGRYVSTGTLKRVSKGVFYKPEQTIFGLMPPSDEDIITIPSPPHRYCHKY